MKLLLTGLNGTLAPVLARAASGVSYGASRSRSHAPLACSV